MNREEIFMKKSMIYVVCFMSVMLTVACGAINRKPEEEIAAPVETTAAPTPEYTETVTETPLPTSDSADGKLGDKYIRESIKNIELPKAFSGYESENENLGSGWLFRYKDTDSITTVDLEEETDSCCYAYGGIIKVPHANYKMEQGEIKEVNTFSMQGIVPKNASVEQVENCDAPAVVLEAEGASLAADTQKKYDNTDYWSVFFGKEDSSYEFVLFLNQKYFSKEDIIKLAQSIQFSENAFSEW